MVIFNAGQRCDMTPDWQKIQQPTKVYRSGFSSLGPGTIVTVNGLPLPVRFDIDPCTTGFDWGGSGAECKQLALALAVDLFGEADWRLHADVLLEVIVSKLKGDESWLFTDMDVALILRAHPATAYLGERLLKACKPN
jgi:hypothetical protein